ncbi:MAG: hypothetical protein IPL61_37340 [Myxococcales bacterium]|nr:hypothetical protein [Myxococcales bacterium]
MRRPVLIALATIATAALAVRAAPADACVRASEANRLLGWSADGTYALLALVDDHGAIDHAEILPTSYQGSVYVITPDEAGAIIVTKVKVGQCASFGDEEDAPVVERKRGKLTDASLRGLKTVKAMKFGTAEVAPAAAAPTPTAAFTGAKRYAAHDLAITAGATTTTMPMPVWCVGSCLRDEHWDKWKAEVAAVHTLASGTVLYELRLVDVCNGGTLIRVVTQTPAKIKVPRRRCGGSGQ